jgi:regulator of RNase E activity RraA
VRELRAQVLVVGLGYRQELHAALLRILSNSAHEARVRGTIISGKEREREEHGHVCEQNERNGP